MSGPSGNQLVLFSLKSDVSLDFISGKHQVSRENRVHKYAKFGIILCQDCSDDSTEVTEGVTSTPEIFVNKHSFVLTFFATSTIYVNCKCCKAELNHRN